MPLTLNDERTLGPEDYAVITLMVLFTSGIGLYYRISKKKDATTATHDTYFLADRKMTILPVALSIFATSVASASVIGLPTETYTFGLQPLLWLPVNFLVAYVVSHVFMPLYYGVNSMNAFKFLEIRYSKRVKNVACIFSIIRLILIGSNITYGTSTVLGQASGIDHWTIMFILTATCTVYTTLSGMKGVMMADASQSIVMLIAMFAALTLGLVNVGGIGSAWTSNLESGRLDILNFDVDLTTRHTVWTSMFGYFFIFLSLMASSQAIIQRFLTAPTIKVARRGFNMGIVLFTIATLMSQLLGAVIYAKFRECDPLRSKMIGNANQLVPAFVTKVLGLYPLLPGLFFAGLVSASLSTLSSLFNSAPAMFIETFILPLKSNITDRQISTVCKIASMLMGCLTLASVLATSQFANVKQAAISISAIVDGSTLVLTTVGFLFPQASYKAVILAFLSGVSVNSWLVAGTLIVHSRPKTKPLSIAGCPLKTAAAAVVGNGTLFALPTNSSSSQAAISPIAKYFPLHNVSYMWIGLIGFLVASIVFVLLSHVFAAEQKRKVSLDIIPKSIQKFHLTLSRPWRRLLLCDVYDGDDASPGKRLEERIELDVKCSF